MLSLENSRLILRIAEDGSSFSIIDVTRRCEWGLEVAHQGYRRRRSDEVLQELRGARVRKDGDRIAVSYSLDEGTIRYIWTMGEDHVKVWLETDVQDIEHVSLPGSFRSRDGRREIAVPVSQGFMLKDSGTTWQRRVLAGGRRNFSLAMGAVLGEAGALLMTHESPVNWSTTFGESGEGPFFFFEEHRCPVDGWTGGAVHLYPVDADVTSICKRYRACVRRRGDFVSWSDKIAEKPIIRELFGALFAFLGYNKTPDIDYAGSARKLKSCGFDSIFFYSLRMLQYSLKFKMGGDDPIWLSDEEIADIKAIEGSHLAPWGWVIGGLDDGSEPMQRIFRRGPEDDLLPHWRIDNDRWYYVCTPYQVEHTKKRFAGDMRLMDWIHFDVNALRPGMCCFSREHEAHGNRPMGHREDMEWTRRLFSAETMGNRVVSSEGFFEHYVPYYEIGSKKAMPSRQVPSTSTAVPMTMLVYHDSCIHHWWELHTYNATPGYEIQEGANGIGSAGSGEPRLKAALDALYGCPPNLFPFGRQYAFKKGTNESYSFLVRLEDAEVQEAIREALPVAKLHKKVGMCEMESFEFLSPDRTVQATTFSDGTRVVANLCDEEREAEGVGRLPGLTWREGKA